MLLLITSFIAGMLSVLAPCVIALIPILLARTIDGKRNRNPFFVIGGLSASIFVFTLALKASTLLISVPTRTWQIVSGVIIVLFGVTYIFPSLWEKASAALGLSEKANKVSGKALQKQGRVGDVLLGASLGPVFSACSPTYALIVASILPTSPIKGLLHLIAFIAGLAGMLSLIAIGGSKLVKRLGWGINPNGWFKRILGVIFLVVGILIATGLDKEFLGWLVQNGWFDWQVTLESQLTQ